MYFNKVSISISLSLYLLSYSVVNLIYLITDPAIQRIHWIKYMYYQKLLSLTETLKLPAYSYLLYAGSSSLCIVIQRGPATGMISQFWWGKEPEYLGEALKPRWDWIKRCPHAVIISIIIKILYIVEVRGIIKTDSVQSSSNYSVLAKTIY